MTRKRYALASKANAKRFCEAEIEDQLIEVENILSSTLDAEQSNFSYDSPAICIDKNNKVQDNDLNVESELYDPPNCQTENAEYNEYSSNDELEDTQIEIEYLRNCPVHDIEAYLLNFLTEWGVRDVSFKKMDKLLAGLRVIFPGLPKSHKTVWIIVNLLHQTFLHQGAHHLYLCNAISWKENKMLIQETLTEQSRLQPLKMVNFYIYIFFLLKFSSSCAYI